MDVDALRAAMWQQTSDAFKRGIVTDVAKSGNIPYEIAEAWVDSCEFRIEIKDFKNWR